jgi:hypothetical protein
LEDDRHSRLVLGLLPTPPNRARLPEPVWVAPDPSILEESTWYIGHLGDLAIGHLAYDAGARPIGRAGSMRGRGDSEPLDRGRPSLKAWPSGSSGHLYAGPLAPYRQASLQPFGTGPYVITTPPGERVFRRQRPVRRPTVAACHRPRVRLSGGGAGGGTAARIPGVWDSRGLLLRSVAYTPTQLVRPSGWTSLLTCGILSSEPRAGVNRAPHSNPTWEDARLALPRRRGCCQWHDSADTMGRSPTRPSI